MSMPFIKNIWAKSQKYIIGEGDAGS